MQLTINGERQQLDGDKWNLTRLLEAQQVQQPETVSVQVNGQFVAKEAYESTRLKDNDEVDFLYFMGGGK
jgi:sulfur carrier protein